MLETEARACHFAETKPTMAMGETYAASTAGLLPPDIRIAAENTDLGQGDKAG